MAPDADFEAVVDIVYSPKKFKQMERRLEPWNSILYKKVGPTGYTRSLLPVRLVCRLNSTRSIELILRPYSVLGIPTLSRT